MLSGSIHTSPTPSFIANAALATKYAAVKSHTVVNEVVVATATTDETIGFTQEEQATAGHAVPVKVEGYTLANAGSGGWTRGDKLTPAADGELITTTTAANKVCAIAEDTVSDNETGEVKIISPAVRYDSF